MCPSSSAAVVCKSEKGGFSCYFVCKYSVANVTFCICPYEWVIRGTNQCLSLFSPTEITISFPAPSLHTWKTYLPLTHISILKPLRHFQFLLVMLKLCARRKSRAHPTWWNSCHLQGVLCGAVAVKVTLGAQFFAEAAAVRAAAVLHLVLQMIGRDKN